MKWRQWLPAQLRHSSDAAAPGELLLSTPATVKAAGSVQSNPRCVAPCAVTCIKTVQMKTIVLSLRRILPFLRWNFLEFSPGTIFCCSNGLIEKGTASKRNQQTHSPIPLQSVSFFSSRAHLVLVPKLNHLSLLQTTALHISL